MRTLILLIALAVSAGAQTKMDTTYQFKDGSLFTIVTPLVDGKVHGVELVYLEKSLYTETPFEMGEQMGVETWYFPSGKVKWTVSFNSGTYHGASTHYDESGKVTKETWYFYGLKMTKEDFDAENSKPYVGAF